MKERTSWGGRYAIHDELASGGMATIYLAVRLSPDEAIPPVVALKKLADQFAKQPEFVAMFLDEAHLAARIRHPNVVATYEFLRTDEGLGIVMDLVVGESLMQLVRGHNSGPQPPAPLPVSLAIVTGALDGLQAAHEISDDSGKALSLVHRDVSPHNILVGADGVARVIDFGIAKAAGRLQTTDVGVLKGKFAYMSPEQIRGGKVDRRTDVYASGIVLWESLTGRKLFRASTNEELLTQRTSGALPIARPSSINADVPPALDELVLRALSPDPSERFGSALAMAETIRADHEVADDATVARWVNSRAGDKLASLEAKKRDLEDRLRAGPSSPPLRRPLVSVASRPSMPAVRPAPLTDIPDLVASPVVDVPETPPVAKGPDDRAEEPLKPRPRFGGDLDLDDGAAPAGVEPPMRIDLDSNSLVAGLHGPAPGSVARVSSLRPSRAGVSRRGSFGTSVLLIILVAALALGALVAGPTLLHARVVAAAKAYGVSIVLDRAELSRRGVVLAGVRGSLSGCPSIRFVAAEVDVDLDAAGGVRTVLVPGYDLSVTGTAAEVVRDLAGWRREPHQPLALDAKAGHAVWSRPMTPTMVVEALDVTLSIAAPDGRITLDSPGLLVNLPRAHVGPWRAHFESASAATRARIALDPSNPDGAPSATVLQRPTEGTSWTVDVPRASTFKAGIPAEFLSIASDLAVEVALSGTLSSSGDRFTCEGHVGLFGLEVGAPRAAVPVDLVVSGRVDGDPVQPLALTGGRLALGKGTSPASGSIVMKEDGVRVELNALATRASGSPALVLDTREWTAAVKGARAASASP